jgi:hypothetical protein
VAASSSGLEGSEFNLRFIRKSIQAHPGGFETTCEVDMWYVRWQRTRTHHFQLLQAALNAQCAPALQIVSRFKTNGSY